MSRRGTRRDDDDDWDDYVQQGDEPVPSQDSEESEDPSVSQVMRPGGIQDMFRDEGDEDEGIDMSVAELLYSTSSFYAIVIPGRFFYCLICVKVNGQQPHFTSLINSDDYNGFIGSGRGLHQQRPNYRARTTANVTSLSGVESG